MICWCLLGLVVLAPLPFASVYAWSWGLMACVVGGLLIAWGVGRLIAKDRPEVGPRSTWPYVLLFSLVIGWAAFQSFPAAPEGWHHPLWGSTGAALGTDVAGTLLRRHMAGFYTAVDN